MCMSAYELAVKFIFKHISRKDLIQGMAVMREKKRMDNWCENREKLVRAQMHREET